MPKEELPSHVQQGMKKSIEQADKRECITFDEVKKLVSDLLKKQPSK